MNKKLGLSVPLSVGVLFAVVLLVSNNSHLWYAALMGSTLLVGLSVLSVTGFLLSIIQLRKIDKDIFYLSLIFAVLGGVFFVMAFAGPHMAQGFKRAFQVLSVFCVLYCFFLWGRQGKVRQNFRAASGLIGALFLINFIWSFLTARFSDYSSILANPNTFGLWVCLMTLMLMADEKRRWGFWNLFFIVLGVYLMFVSSSRTSLIAFLAGFIVFVIPRNILEAKFFKVSAFFALMVTSCLSIYVTVYFDLSVYNAAMRDISGKNLLSGRHVIWPLVMDYVWIKPWFGWGSGIDLSDISHFTLSAHNSFLQTLLQIGFVGLLIFMLLALRVYISIYRRSDGYFFKISLAMFFAMFIMQNLEITMIQNNLALSYPAWAVIGLSIGHCHYQRRLRYV